MVCVNMYMSVSVVCSGENLYDLFPVQFLICECVFGGVFVWCCVVQLRREGECVCVCVLLRGL